MYVEVPTKWKDNSAPFCCSAPSLQCAGSAPPPCIWSYDLQSEETLQVHGSQTTTQTMKNRQLRKRRETGVSTYYMAFLSCRLCFCFATASIESIPALPTFLAHAHWEQGAQEKITSILLAVGKFCPKGFGQMKNSLVDSIF